MESIKNQNIIYWRPKPNLCKVLCRGPYLTPRHRSSISRYANDRLPVSLEKLYLVGGCVWKEGPNFVAMASEDPLGMREFEDELWYRLWRLRNALTPTLFHSLKPSSIKVRTRIVQITPATKIDTVQQLGCWKDFMLLHNIVRSLYYI